MPRRPAFDVEESYRELRDMLRTLIDHVDTLTAEVRELAARQIPSSPVAPLPPRRRVPTPYRSVDPRDDDDFSDPEMGTPLGDFDDIPNPEWEPVGDDEILDILNCDDNYDPGFCIRIPEPAYSPATHPLPVPTASDRSTGRTRVPVTYSPLTDFQPPPDHGTRHPRQTRLVDTTSTNAQGQEFPVPSPFRREDNWGVPLSDVFEELELRGILTALPPPEGWTPPPLFSRIWCAYHRETDHDTDDCGALRHALQDLIDNGVVPRPDGVSDPFATWAPLRF